MDLISTLTLAAVAMVATILFGWIGARPAKAFSRPRLVPWQFLMMIAIVVVIAALVHAVALIRAVNGSSPS
jgi:uncharacterized membrane protein YsdA (DUF1294 family)